MEMSYSNPISSHSGYSPRPEAEAYLCLCVGYPWSESLCVHEEQLTVVAGSAYVHSIWGVQCGLGGI